jgi:hypothetical protein
MTEDEKMKLRYLRE